MNAYKRFTLMKEIVLTHKQAIFAYFLSISIYDI